MKAGTSWIQGYLESRGDVCLPQGVKETFFFDRHWERGSAWYASHFAHCAPGLRAVAEIGPTYFHSAAAPARIRELLGPVPLVVTLRDPVARSWSHYLHLRRKGYTRRPLREAAVRYPEIVAASRYEETLGRWRDVCGSDRIHVTIFDLLLEDPERFVAELCDVLCLPTGGVPEVPSNAANAAAVAPFPWLASAASRAGNAFRSRRWYRVVNLAKRLGLQEVVFGRPGARALPERTPDEDEWLKEQLVEETRWFGELRRARMRPQAGDLRPPTGR